MPVVNSDARRAEDDVRRPATFAKHWVDSLAAHRWDRTMRLLAVDIHRPTHEVSIFLPERISYRRVPGFVACAELRQNARPIVYFCISRPRWKERRCRHVGHWRRRRPSRIIDVDRALPFRGRHQRSDLHPGPIRNAAGTRISRRSVKLFINTIRAGLKRGIGLHDFSNAACHRNWWRKLNVEAGHDSNREPGVRAHRQPQPVWRIDHSVARAAEPPIIDVGCIFAAGVFPDGSAGAIGQCRAWMTLCDNGCLALMLGLERDRSGRGWCIGTVCQRRGDKDHDHHEDDDCSSRRSTHSSRCSRAQIRVARSSGLHTLELCYYLCG